MSPANKCCMLLLTSQPDRLRVGGPMGVCDGSSCHDAVDFL